MRKTSFIEKHLFNDNFHERTYLFMWNGKGWAESKLMERQREREKPSLRKGYGVGIIDLRIGQVIYEG
jgi:hypothetical protein